MLLVPLYFCEVSKSISPQPLQRLTRRVVRW